MVVAKEDNRIICTAFCNGKKHDFKLLSESDIHIESSISVLVDSGYQGLQKSHEKTSLPKKKSKHSPLSKEDKRDNRELASKRAQNEHVIGRIKRFKIIQCRYRNRRRRFGLRFNLLAGIHNFELEK